MRTNSRSRGAGLVLTGLAVVIFAPEWANAQQTGLFPLAPIRRQRTPVDQEDPVYKTFRQKYYGYHPTCWRRFPDGWGCPSKEAPDRVKSFRDVPLGQKEELGPLRDEGQMDGERPEVDRPAIPAVPGTDRSPFTPLDNAPGGGAAGERPKPPVNDDPFNIPDAKPAPDATRPQAPATPAPRPAPPLDLAPPVAPDGTKPAPRASRGPAPAADSADGEEGPLLALPSITAPPADENAVFDPGATRVPAAQPVADAPPPARRGLISGFFSSLGSSWIRR